MINFLMKFQAALFAAFLRKRPKKCNFLIKIYRYSV